MKTPAAAAPTTPGLHVACLCAAWCRLCDDYMTAFERVTLALRSQHPGLQTHWIDIEDEAELLGEFDVETFPTLVVVVGDELRFAGPLAPQPETLQRVLATVLATPQPGPPAPPEVLAFARRLRLRVA
ncbi:MAG: thioredoxin family protein [Rubrivivax sp.]|nr:thioredoxin family protein [Rubrivivax sp.]